MQAGRLDPRIRQGPTGAIRGVFRDRDADTNRRRTMSNDYDVIVLSDGERLTGAYTQEIAA